MARYRYQFNPESLSFKKVEFGLLEELYKKLFTQFVITLVFGGIFFALAIYFLDSPQLEALKEKNRQLRLKFEFLNNEFAQTEHIIAEIAKRDDNVYRSIFETEPIAKEIRYAGIGGSERYADLEGFENSAIVINAAKRLDLISKQLYVQTKSYDEIAGLIEMKEKMLSAIPAIQPVSNKFLTGFGPFGMRFHPILHIYRLHAGVDLCAPEGTPIYAAGDGKVIECEYNSGLGYYVKVSHGYGYVTVYGHASKILAKVGDKVKRGETIALVGTTGLSTTNHLHYEVHKNGEPVNPVNYYYNDLSQEEYDRMIELSQTTGNVHVE